MKCTTWTADDWNTEQSCVHFLSFKVKSRHYRPAGRNLRSLIWNFSVSHCDLERLKVIKNHLNNNLTSSSFGCFSGWNTKNNAFFSFFGHLLYLKAIWVFLIIIVAWRIYKTHWRCYHENTEHLKTSSGKSWYKYWSWEHFLCICIWY